MSAHATTLPKMYQDAQRPGIIRFEGSDDPTLGLLVGIKAPEIVRRCNAHDALVKIAMLARAMAHDRVIDATGDEDGRRLATAKATLRKIDAALALAKGGAE